jgi:hypothetical protein
MEKTWENHRTTVKIQRKTGNIPIFHVKHIGHHYLSIYIYIHQWRLDCQSEGKLVVPKQPEFDQREKWQQKTNNKPTTAGHL